jgi:hypothetical protein
MWHYDGLVKEVVVRYDNDPVCTSPPVNPPQPDSFCNIQFNVPETIPGPAYLYYRLTNFYQNHRRYVSSRTDSQLAGEPITSVGSISSCTPIISLNGTSNYTGFYNPCGLVADSYFNDAFDQLVDASTATELSVRRSGISWSSDRATKFKRIDPAVVAADPGIVGIAPPNLEQFVPPGDYFNVTNEDFIVWMRVAGLPTFRKLYGVIEAGVPAGDYTLRVNNRYAVERFGNGTKSIVISNTSFIGGKNAFLGLAFIVVGSICLLAALVFFLINLIRPRQLGDPALLSWNKNQ